MNSSPESILEPHQRYQISEIFFFRSPHSQENVTVRLYRNTLQLLQCSMEHDASANFSTSTNTSIARDAYTPETCSTPVPRLTFLEPCKRYYLHDAIQLRVEAQKIVSLRSKLKAEKFEFIFLAESQQVASAFRSSVHDRLQESRKMLEKSILRLQSPTLLNVKLNSPSLRNSNLGRDSLTGKSFMWLDKEAKTLIINSHKSDDEAAHHISISSIHSFTTLYKQEDRKLKSRLILSCSDCFLSIEFPHTQHGRMVEWYLSLQHLSVTSEDSHFSQYSILSVSDLLLRKAKFAARYFFIDQEREQIEDIHIPEETEENRRNQKENVNQRLKPSESQRTLVNRNFFQLSSMLNQRRQSFFRCLDLNRHASVSNIFGREQPMLEKDEVRAMDRSPIPASYCRPPHHRYFDDSCEIDPDLYHESNNAQQSLASYSSVPSFNHSKQLIEKKYNRRGDIGSDRTQSTLQKSKRKYSDASPYHRILSSLIKQIKTPFQSNKSPKVSLFSQLFPISPLVLQNKRKQSPKKSLFRSASTPDSPQKMKRDEEQIEGRAEMGARDGLNLSTIHQAKRSFLTPSSQFEEELKMPQEELQNLDMLFSPVDLTAQETQNKTVQCLSEIMKEERKSRSDDNRASPRQDEVETLRRGSDHTDQNKIMRTFHSDISLRKGYREDTENNHPVSPCPPKLCSLKNMAEKASPLSLISPSLRRLGALRNSRPLKRRNLNVETQKLDTNGNVSTAITPMQDHSKQAIYQESEVKEFLFKDKSPLNSSCTSNLIHNKENKDVVASLSSLKNQGNQIFNVGMTSQYTEPLSRETGAFGATRLTSLISPPSRQFELAKDTRNDRIHPAQLLEENIREIQLSRYEGTESDIRSELRDHIYEDMYDSKPMEGIADTERPWNGGECHHRASSSLTTFKHTLGLRSKASKIREDSRLNDTCLADPDLAFLFNDIETSEIRGRNNCFSISSSLAKSTSRMESSLKNTLRRESADDIVIGSNPRLSVALSRFPPRNMLQNEFETATFAPRKARRMGEDFEPRGRSTKPVYNEEPFSDFNKLRREVETESRRAKRGKTQCSHLTTTVLPSDGISHSCQEEPQLNFMQLQYHQKYLEEKEKNLVLQQEYQTLLHRQQRDIFRREKMEKRFEESEAALVEKIQLLQRENKKLKEEKQQADQRANKARKDKREIEAHYDILSVRFRQVEKYLMPKKVCLRKQQTARESLSVTRF